MEYENHERQARILLYDLEVTPLKGWAYGEWKTDILHVEQYSYVLCFSYRWLGEPIKTVSLLDFPVRYEADPTDDLDVVKELWRLFDQADIIIAHNNDRFDMRVANGRFMVHNLTPPSPVKTVDTLKAYRRWARFSSNALDKLGRQLELGRKTKTTYGQLWLDCVNGSESAWKKMVRYCEQDVRLLERLYLRIRPYITNHPNVATLAHLPDACPKCGHNRLQRRGYYSATTYTYQRYVCKKCGGWGRVRLSEGHIIKPTYVNTN